jgi:hypothetical protein
LEKYREVLEAYMLRLDQSGLLDQDTVPAFGPTNETPWWSKGVCMETLRSLPNLQLDDDKPSRVETLQIDVQQSLADVGDNPEAANQLPDSPMAPLNATISSNVRNPKPMNSSRADQISSSNFEPIERRSSLSAHDRNSDGEDAKLNGTKRLREEWDFREEIMRRQFLADSIADAAAKVSPVQKLLIFLFL